MDTGASDSIMNPEIASRFPIACKFSDIFSVKTIFTTYTNNENISFPIFSEIGIRTSINFRILKWHDKYDVLLGSRDLKQFNANLNYQQQTITILNKTLSFSLKNTKNNLIPVNQISGYAVVPTIDYPNLNIPPSIHRVQNGHIYWPDIPENIKFNHPIEVYNLNNYQIINTPMLPKTPLDTCLLRLDHLNKEEKEAILSLCRKYSQLFHAPDTPLSATTHTKHFIRTSTETPVYTKLRRYPQSIQEAIAKQVNDLLDAKIIRPSISPYSSPAWIVDKKPDASGKKKVRMVINYSKLNDQTIEDKFPLPRIDEILDNLGKSQYFTCLDLSQGYHQILMDERSIEKTAFTTPQGHFEYTRLPFGLKNAPSSFQRIMNEVLSNHINKRCFVYLDDIIIFSKSLQQHINDIKLIFDDLAKANLKIQPFKSEFLTKKVEFLGHIVTPQGISPNPKKIEAIQKYPIPVNVKEIKSFLGLIGYYRRFIPNFAHIVYPINKCTRKGEKIDPTDPTYLRAFEHCKTLIATSPILAYPDFEKKFTVTTDASDIAIGSVLSQENHPIAFYSRTLNSAEKNYSTIERELLSIVEATKHFRPYLYGRRFLIQTDHNPLVWLNKLKTINSRLIRWKIKLDEYEYDIEHLKGSVNKVADALSRVEINIHNKDDTDSLAPMEIDNNPSAPSPTDDNTVHSQEENISCGLSISEKPVNIFKHQILLTHTSKNRYALVKRFDKQIHVLGITRDTPKEELLAHLLGFLNPSTTYGLYLYQPELRPLMEGVLSENFTQFDIRLTHTKLTDVIDEQEQQDTIKSYHNKNHNGITETYLHLKSVVYFPNLKNKITIFINKCDICQQAKYERKPYKVPYEGPILPTKPLETIHSDIYFVKGSMFLTMIDPFSKYAQVYHIPDKTTPSILTKMRHFFAHHNFPKKIVTDNEPAFVSAMFREYLKLHGIEHHTIAIGNSSSNSPIERFHSTLTEKLKILTQTSPKEAINNLVITAVTIYNQSIHASTGHTPFNILYGPYATLPIFDEDFPVYDHYVQQRKLEMQPFLDHIYRNTASRMNSKLEKINTTRKDPTPVLSENSREYSTFKAKYNKLSLNKPINITQQNGNTFIAKDSRQKSLKMNVKSLKRVRKTK